MIGGTLLLRGAVRLTVAGATQGLRRLGTPGAGSGRSPTPAHLLRADQGARRHQMGGITTGLREGRGRFLLVDEAVVVVCWVFRSEWRGLARGNLVAITL